MLVTLCLMQPISLLYCKSTLLARVQFGVLWHLQGLFCQYAFQLGGSQNLLLGALTPQVQDFAFLLDVQEIPASPFIQPVQVPLDESMTCWHISHPLGYHLLVPVLYHLVMIILYQLEINHCSSVQVKLIPSLTHVSKAFTVKCVSQPSSHSYGAYLILQFINFHLELPNMTNGHSTPNTSQAVWIEHFLRNVLFSHPKLVLPIWSMLLGTHIPSLCWNGEDPIDGFYKFMYIYIYIDILYIYYYVYYFNWLFFKQITCLQSVYQVIQFFTTQSLFQYFPFSTLFITYKLQSVISCILVSDKKYCTYQPNPWAILL